MTATTRIMTKVNACRRPAMSKLMNAGLGNTPQVIS